MHTTRARSKFVLRLVLTLPHPTLPLNRQSASSTNTRQVQNVYEGQFYVPVQSLALSTSQNVVRIQDSDRDRVIIANQVIIRFIAQRVMRFFHPQPLVPTSCGVRPRFSSKAHRRVGYTSGSPKSSNGETNLSSSSSITEAHLPCSHYGASPPLGDH